MLGALAVVVGTRPELIKVSPIVDQLVRLDVDVRIAFTGQHHNSVMLACARDMKVDAHVTVVGNGERWREGLDSMLSEFLAKSEPKMLMVVGDTDSAYLTAQTAVRRSRTALVHLEAGLRLSGLFEPEEINRREIVRLARLHIAPTEREQRNLMREGVQRSSIFISGDLSDLSLAYRIDRLGWKASDVHARRYWLATIHRRSNISRLERIASFLIDFSRATESTIVLCRRPDNRLAFFYDMCANERRIHVIQERTPRQFLGMLSGSSGVITDSAGVQQEALLGNLRTIVLRADVELYKDHPSLMLCAEAAITPDLLAGVLERQDRWRYVDRSGLLEAKRIGIKLIRRYL